VAGGTSVDGIHGKATGFSCSALQGINRKIHNVRNGAG
jgi:hypothetical protein